MALEMLHYDIDSTGNYIKKWKDSKSVNDHHIKWFDPFVLSIGIDRITLLFNESRKKDEVREKEGVDNIKPFVTIRAKKKVNRSHGS